MYRNRGCLKKFEKVGFVYSDDFRGSSSGIIKNNTICMHVRIDPTNFGNDAEYVFDFDRERLLPGILLILF